MILKLKTSTGSTLFAHVDRGELRLEDYSGAGTDKSKCEWGRGLTPAQATELKQFLESQGF